MAHANNVHKWRKSTTLARRIHVHKSPVSYPQDMDAFVAMLFLHANFHCGVCACIHEVRAHTMGCKRGFR